MRSGEKVIRLCEGIRITFVYDDVARTVTRQRWPGTYADTGEPCALAEVLMTEYDADGIAIGEQYRSEVSEPDGEPYYTRTHDIEEMDRVCVDTPAALM